MNVYDAMGVLYDSAELPINDQLAHEAKRIVGNVVDAYDALAPDWANAPDWAQWVTLFDNGKFVWWELEPESRIMPNGQYAWTEQDGRMGMVKSGQVSPLPIGIDWRLCKWSREVTK